MGMSGQAKSHHGEAAVVLVSCAGGRELEVVRDALTNSLNTPTVLVTPANLASTAMWFNLNTGLLDVDGRRVRPAVVWVRHSSPGAMVAQAQPTGSVTPLDATSWCRLLEQVSASTNAALPGSAIVGSGSQLMDAGRLGVNVPRTVVTTDVIAGVRQMTTPTVIVKIPDFRLHEPNRQTWPAYSPKIIDRDAVAGDTAAGGRPVVVQEYVAHARELRVYYLNGGICAFGIHKREPSSLWTDPAGVTVSRADCPEDAEKAVRTLCAAWNLRFGAFDLLVSNTGELVFLEANPDGDWLWFERKARWHGVSFMAAVMVRELFVQGTSSGSSHR
jgi:hypothetical protein